MNGSKARMIRGIARMSGRDIKQAIYLKRKGSSTMYLDPMCGRALYKRVKKIFKLGRVL